MERLVKERLVGAAVLLAAAVILIPEMLSGPKHEEAQSRVPTEDAPTKTYTIDLGQPSGQPGRHLSAAPDPAQIETTPVPPAESGPAATTSAAQARPETNVPQTESKREESPGPAAKPAAQPQVEASKPVATHPVPPPKRESVEPSTPAAKPVAVASERSAPTSKGWAVQLGSFSKADTAEHLAQQMRTKGHNAFVMPVKSGAGTLYRVRVGPMSDRAAADALQRQLKGEFSGATVVAHP